jgi:hypothetical protein
MLDKNVLDYMNMTLDNSVISSIHIVPDTEGITIEEFNKYWEKYRKESDRYKNTYSLKRKVLYWLNDDLSRYDDELDEDSTENEIDYIVRDNVSPCDFDDVTKFMFKLFDKHIESSDHIMMLHFPNGKTIVKLHSDELWKYIYEKEDNVIKKYIIYSHYPFWDYVLDEGIDDPPKLIGNKLVAVSYRSNVNN